MYYHMITGWLKTIEVQEQQPNNQLIRGSIWETDSTLNIQNSTGENKMPAKFKATEIVYDRNTKKTTMKHFYLKQTPVQELLKYINEGQKPKIKLKCRNELDRRGVKLNWIPVGELV